jgi:hypothetical protein
MDGRLCAQYHTLVLGMHVLQPEVASLQRDPTCLSTLTHVKHGVRASCLAWKRSNTTTIKHASYALHA